MAHANPLYGTGTFRRRIRLKATQRAVVAELEDCNHGFRLCLAHDGVCVTSVEAAPLRVPFNTCAEAVRPLQHLVGHRLDDGPAALRRRLAPRDNCTHLHDMAALAVAHAAAFDGGAPTTRLYDMAVDDERDGITRARIDCDGEPVHAWEIASAHAHAITAPAPLAGKPMMRGFHAWASQAFGDMACEAAVALQRAYLVAQARRHCFEPAAEHPGISDGMPDGVCYSYNTGVVERALRSDGTVRDFTHTPEHLLMFLS